ncbi:MFS transporter [Metarhizium album ARSEF 1941]|uniref:MFS transporter n=1 Tax=Metarhizium album (strain ARSEF 1941) TaxID=1081103 RepID=A0A0B2WYX6_METAS|nr:MFS transporter [Metarhizium album ARSEF 1941]KHN98739.1 MFS transporter [Metarhizium album ARSEF 1941]
MARWKSIVSPMPSPDVPGLESVDISDKAMERRIVRKQDLRILPWVCLTYLLNYLDRVNLGNARTLNNDTPENNMVTQLNLTGQRYNVAVALFFVPYVLMEFPSNILLKYFSPSRWIARIMVSWGIITICTAAVTTYGGLLAVRMALGLAEAGFFPGIMMYLCFWYRPEERATRMAIFATSVSVAGTFGGLLATVISFLNKKAGLSGWQWLFMLEGIPAVIAGIMVWFWLPDYPQTSAWLTPEERAFAVKRLGPHAPSMKDKHWDSHVTKKTVVDPWFWLFAAHYFLMTNSLNAFGYFAPTIVAALGYKGYQAQLMTVPPNVVAMIIVIGVCLHSDKTRERPRHILGALAFLATGYLLLAVVSQRGVRYFAVCIIACTNAAVLPFVAYRTATVQGSTATALATGGMIAIANCGGVSAPFLFPSGDSPMYSKGNWTIFGFLVSAALLTIWMWYALGSHAGYRIGERHGQRNMEVLDAVPCDSDDSMNKAFGISKPNQVDD